MFTIKHSRFNLKEKIYIHYIKTHLNSFKDKNTTEGIILHYRGDHYSR